MTDLRSLKLKDGALKFLYSLLPPIVRDYRWSFYFDTTIDQPCKSIANNNVDFGLRLPCWILEVSEVFGLHILPLEIVL